MFAQFANFFNTASLPGGTRVYAIGDIHGYPDALETLLEQVHTDIRQAPHVKSQIVFLGDYVNRGPDTPKVLSALISEKKMQKLDGVERHFLVGNHDLWFGGFLANDNVRFHGTINFLCNGGARALENYGVSISQEASRVKTVFSGIANQPFSYRVYHPEAIAAAKQEMAKAVPAEHRDFLLSLKPRHVLGDYFFVHAGIDPKRGWKDQDLETMTMSRTIMTHTGKWDKRVVHGHTITNNPLVTENQISVDTGIYESGVLTCAVLEGAGLRFLQSKTKYPAYVASV